MRAATSTSSTRTSSARTTRSTETSINTRKIDEPAKPLTAYSPAPKAPPDAPAASPPQRTAPAPKFGLAWRIFLGSAAVVAIVLVATLAVASTVASSNATKSIQAGLEQTNARVFDQLAGERTTLLRLAQQHADNPDFRSSISSSRASKDTTGAFATLFDLATVTDSTIGANRTQIVDAEGTLLARSDIEGEHGASLVESALVTRALEGSQAQGFAVVDSTLAQAVAVPIRGGVGSLIGVLMAFRKIDDSLAAKIGRQTGSELVFYHVPGGGSPEISVSSPRLGDKTTLRAAIDSSFKVQPAAIAQRDTTSMMLALGGEQEILIGGTHYVGERVAALSASGNEVGGFIALRDRDQELAPYYKLRNALLFAGVGGLLLAFVLSVVISRRIVRPVQALVGATQAAADGDYNATIPVSTGDEIGTLASAFQRLLADLRDKQALVEFLQSPGSGRTIGFKSDFATMPTMQMAAMGGAVLEPGQTLALRYDIEKVLGIGGMGMVYKAADRELGELVAIKTLKPDMMEQDPSALDRFKSEIRLARKIAHRNVVRTYDLGENGGVYFITMEFVEGKSLKELIQSRGRLPVAIVLPIAKQLCRALEVAHEEGVIHRDIKPANMVVQPDGVLKVMDFGIARLVHRTEGQTQAGMVVGTPEYMAPEQLLGDNIDERADLYSAGVVLYECLTGKMPHTAQTPITLITKVLEETPTPPRELQSDIPAALSDLVMRVLSKNREDRPKNALELHDALDRLEMSTRAIRRTAVS
jgi:HAMP domain-containing protein/sensor domain CHASE-containing protein/predicted Ser/Thr protein kinase